MNPTLKNVELGLATEMNAIIARLGHDHPDLFRHLSTYIRTLPTRHPDWIPVMRRAHSQVLEKRLRLSRPRQRKPFDRDANARPDRR